MLRLFWRNRYFNKTLSTALFGSCFFINSYAQTTPLETPPSVTYPGIIETFEKLIQIDAEKLKRKQELLTRAGKTITDPASVTALDLDSDYLNSIILHSNPGYIKMASTSKCRFYDTILNDLFRNTEGKLKNVFVTYVTKNNERESAIIPTRDFLSKVVSQECPETAELTNLYQVKSIGSTIKDLNFEIPKNQEQCARTYSTWLRSAHTPYLCKVHEYISESAAGIGDSKTLGQRRSVARVLNQKISSLDRDYIENICTTLESEKLFCDKFLNVSFWNKIAAGVADKIYASDICSSNTTLKQCVQSIKNESDLCLYPNGTGTGLLPQMNCEYLGMALNHSSFRSDYKDCPGASDQHGITNLGRILLNITNEKILPFNGPCSAISSGVTYQFNERFDNEEAWKLEACYNDKLAEREICYKTFFGQYGLQAESYNNVVAIILKKAINAPSNLTCRMVSSADYNPLLLDFKTGCHIIYEKNLCFISKCEHRILYNGKNIDFITVKNTPLLPYFPVTVKDERFSQHYLLTRDFKRKGRSYNDLSSIKLFFKTTKNGILHGTGCAEDLLPTFFRKQAFNQCSPITFIIDGIISEKDDSVFVTRTSLDSLQAPRLISWSSLFSGVKSYQQHHPLRFWTLYGLD